MAKKVEYIPGPAGQIELEVNPVGSAPYARIGIVCHPHPLHQGTMHNKVVTTLVKSFNAMGITTVRFNYRGVCGSEGEHDNAVGEVEDGLCVHAWLQQQCVAQPELWLAGFSFGAYIAAAMAARLGADQLLTVAPSVARMPYSQLPAISCPWLVIQGEQDEVVAPEEVYAWYTALQANKTLLKFPETSHFFHGKLIALQQAIEEHYAQPK